MATHPTSHPDIMSVLEDRGYRTTAPRRAIIGILEGKREGFTVEEISNELPFVGRATVFRTVKLLMEVGAVCRLNLIDGAPRYSLSNVGHHHHTVCVECGNVGEFRADTIERLVMGMGNNISDEIVGHRVEIYVICEKCNNDQGA